MNRNVIVSCAVTGSGDSVDKHPAIPVTPKEIAAEGRPDEENIGPNN